jgi:MFS family permease
MTSSASESSLGEWKASWTLVLASFIGFLLHSMPISALSAYIGPLEAEFGWSRTFISGGITVGSGVSALLMPVVGAMADRFGSRRVVLPGIVLSALSWALIALITGEQWQWLSLFLFHAIFNVMIGAVLWTTAVAGSFKTSQGMALGITLAGATGAHTVVPALTVALIDGFGWRMASVLLAAGLGLLAYVLCHLFFFDRRDRLRIATAAGKAPVAADSIELPGLTLREAAFDTALWRIGVSILLIMALTIGFLVHQIEILSAVGVTRSTAAWLAGLSGAMGIVGKLATGWLLDRYRGDVVGGVTMAAAGIAFAMLIATGGSALLIVLAMLVNGYTAGAKLQVASYLTVRYAGLRNFGKIYGFISALVAAGAAIGPLVAGLFYDLTGSYVQFLVASAIGMGVSALLLISLPRYPDWSGSDRRAGQDKPAAATA